MRSTLAILTLTTFLCLQLNAESQIMLGASFGQLKNDSTVDLNDLRNAYEGKIGFKEDQGIFAVAYNYVETQEQKDPAIKEQYSSVLVLLDGLTEPTKFIGPMKAQLLFGVHGGMIFADVNGVQKNDLQYGLQTGAYLPMGKMMAIELLYRYSFTNMTFDEFKIDNIQQLNLGMSFNF